MPVRFYFYSLSPVDIVTRQVYKFLDNDRDLSLISKLKVTVERKNILRRHEESLRGTSLKRDPIFFWVTPDTSENKNHYFSTVQI